MINRIAIFCALSGLLLSGCTFTMPQFASLQRLFATPAKNIDEYAWTLSVGDYESTVYAVTSKQGTVFASYNNDSLLFDGFVIRKVNSLAGFNTPISFEGFEQVAAGTKRRFDANGVETQLNCAQKVAVDDRAVQQCAARDNSQWQFVMVFGPQGELIEIQQTIDKLGSVVTLTKNQG